MEEGEGSAKRARLWEHQEGVYATAVFLPAPPTAELRRVQEAALAAARAAWGEAAAGLAALPALHVSLTRTLPVGREERARLTRRLSAALLGAGETAFVALRVEAAALERLVARLDGELAALGQPVFPRPALLHVSLGWLLGDWTAREAELLAEWARRGEEAEELAELRLTECVLRVGDVEHSFVLPPEE